MGKRYNILIVEDDLLIAEMLKGMLLELNYSVVSICKSYNEAIKQLNTKSKIDLVILDINLSSQKTGIDLAHLLKDEYNLPFVFLTSYSDPVTIKDAVNQMPEAYLLKPFTKSELFSTIELIKLKSGKKDTSYIVVKDGSKKVKLSLDEILFVKSEKNYLEITTTTSRIVTRATLDSFIEEMDNDFCMRVHRSFAVNIKNISALNHQEISIGDVKIPLSRKFKDGVHFAFSQVN